MVERKTQATAMPVEDFIENVPEPRRQESLTLDTLLRTVTGEVPTMWGANIVGYGTFDYTTASGKVDTWFPLGFSPRKAQMTIYVTPGFDQLGDELSALGPHSIGKSCLYVKRLEAIDLQALERLFRTALDHLPRTD